LAVGSRQTPTKSFLRKKRLTVRMKEILACGGARLTSPFRSRSPFNPLTTCHFDRKNEAKRSTAGRNLLALCTVELDESRQLAKPYTATWAQQNPDESLT